ncbi:MAG: sulfatase [Candidatus Binatia bacterium]|nr:sulfatase [Candidatus Binatia bacterium]
MSNETSEAPASGWLRWLALAVVVVSLGVLVFTRDFDGPPATREGPPSIVLVLIDTLRADYLGTYGFEGDISPELDRVADESIVFESAFSQAPWTKPAIASLFTSLHPEQHGVIAHMGRYGDREGESPRASALPQRAVTMAEMLRGAGYETAAFIANPWIQRRLGFAQGFDVFDAKDVGNQVPARVLLDKAGAWLAQREQDKPFFLYIHLMDVHGPYDAPQDDFDALAGSPGLGEPRPLTLAEAQRRKSYLMRAGGTHGDDLALEAWRGSYAAGVRSVDRQVGAFLTGLSRGGVLDDALLVITSDHGEELADHGAWDHGGTLFDEQIRVPLLVRLPGANPDGRRVERVVSLIDLMPTLLRVAGSTVPKGLAGEDLGPLLAGQEIEKPGVAYASGVKWRPAAKAVRTRDSKLVRSGDVTWVFDVATDPGETRGVPPGSIEIEELAAILDEHGEKLAAGPSFRTEAATMAPGTRDKLRALGYLDEGPPPEPTPPADQTEQEKET